MIKEKGEASKETNSFFTFAKERNIEIIQGKSIRIVGGEDFSEKDLLRQIHTICQFHKRTMGFRDYLRGRLDNKIGKLYEENKVSLRRLIADIGKLLGKGELNDFEKLLLETAPKFYTIAKESICSIDEEEYVKLIVRSMERQEVCLDKVWFNNIVMESGEEIYVKDMTSSSYNLVEMDCIELLKRVRKKGKRVDYVKLAEYFCKESDLDVMSRNFILSMVKFPTEYMLCCNRYREKRKNWSCEVYCKRLMEAMEHEGGSVC
ncbi:hypothetical protein SAMN02745248_01689 [Hathewaya proteolytica DSM 3090]|uniref:Spore coat protein, CotS family n=1 Tax=Hathewaya proteolytica DSM 3090 TaxID=1121331 RepID=A0A1M6PG99_9CLOT|nr:hypothetical protein [Hathewaya proteolytica]SHK06976.1 hypothetical protein SAMN02745248_01689 [Hathewaya proteolytica DSM 3090]